MLLTIAAAIIAIYFWPLTLIVLYFMYWQVTIPLTIIFGVLAGVFYLVAEFVNYLTGKGTK